MNAALGAGRPAASEAGKPRSRRGRPRGGNSDDTRRALVDTALAHFAERGYASTTLTAIAADTGLATSAVYHYFESKEQLYEAVFLAVAPQVWEAMSESVGEASTMLEGIERLVRTRGGHRAPHVSAFLAGMPTVASLHPELGHLLEARIKFQEPIFRRLAETGLRTGELAGLTADQAADVLRAFVLGWLYEQHYKSIDDDSDAVVQAFTMMAAGAGLPRPSRTRRRPSP